MDVTCDKCLQRKAVGTLNAELVCLGCVLDFCRGQKAQCVESQAGSWQCNCGDSSTLTGRHCPRCFKLGPVVKPASQPLPLKAAQQLCQSCKQPYKSICRQCFWKCETCTLADNPKSSATCSACGAWRCVKCDIQNEASATQCVNCRGYCREPERVPTCPRCHAIMKCPNVCGNCVQSQLVNFVQVIAGLKEMFNKSEN